jgi:hypothetical protein
MRRIQIPMTVFCVLTAVHSPAQEGVSFDNMGVVYNAGGCNTCGINGGFGNGGAQLYPFDQQAPWLHGQYQRVPAYGGYSSFRPYNYRHVAPQAQIAANFGGRGGMAYSQQFWNRYREGYLNENLRSQTNEDGAPAQLENVPSRQKPIRYSTEGGPQAQRLLRMPTPMRQVSVPVSSALTAGSAESPVQIYPVGVAGQ